MIRGIDLRGAVSINVITMIGIGPLITIPLVLAQLAGPLALVGWVAGALVALCDGLVWAELGSRYPSSGGTYVYLREAFGRERWGRLFAFLFNWQYFLSASLVISTGYIGFANYTGYLFPAVANTPALTHLVALGIGLLTIVLLYRRISTIAAFSLLLGIVAILTLLIVGAAGYRHADFHRAFTLGAHVPQGWAFLAGLGGALYITLYDYAGYSQVAYVAEECRAPERILPRSIIISVLLVLALYLFLQVGVLAAVPWQSLVAQAGSQQSQYVASAVVAASWGSPAARIVTILILVTAFASVYGGLLGASRVPFAAARDGAFIPAFARLHPKKHFPAISLLAMGAISLLACFFDLGFVIAVLSAASIVMQGIAQIAALFILRKRGERAPFRMWLYPVPAIIALAGWILAFVNTGTAPILLGVAWIAAGIAVYLLTARAQALWPFAAAAAVLLFLGTPAPARAAQPSHFIYGAAFFYERIPRDEWAETLAEYRRLGINTIDLYVIWNWHELRDGDFDFTGRTNPRRDLAGLFKLLDGMHFKIVLRPGPVIRNEWRNGGYPAWLLERPKYRMPLRDVLEGRYPATATLQNAHSDAAAAEWLANSTHMHYATRWLQRVFAAIAPWRRDVVAVALDDDQGAYIDNDTWPAPHFHRYIRYLASVVHNAAGPHMPVFINTYDMKVTASSPVWAWGDWYQSDAYSIGEHDRAQIEFSTGLLQTQLRRPIVVGEFQAGWLQGADQAVPRPADPSNTTLALHTLLQIGVHGIVNFPVQDTLYPAGWEVPWANAFYSWDAALSLQLTPQARYEPTRRFGELIERYGDALAQTHPVADAAVAYLTSAYDPARISNSDIAHIADATMSAQRGCRIMRITCALVDLRYAPLSTLRAYRTIIVPSTGIPAPFISQVAQKLAALRNARVSITPSARYAGISHPAAGGIPNAVLLADDRGTTAFLDIVNYDRRPLQTHEARVRAGRFAAFVPALTVPPRDAVLLPLRAHAAPLIVEPQSVRALSGTRIPLRPGSWLSASFDAPPAHHAVAYALDVYRDGYPAVVLENAQIRLVVSPCAGARALVFEDKATTTNLFTTIGGLRDAWQQQAPPSSRDYIAQYTHPIATGTFNRCYSVRTNASGRAPSAVFSYVASDAPPYGASFERSIRIASDTPEFTVATLAAFPGSRTQHAQQITSFAVSSATQIEVDANGYGFFDPRTHRETLVAWSAEDVLAKNLERHQQDALLTLTLASGRPISVRYGVAPARTGAAAQAELRAFANRA
jgi:amino acid transporter